jgi:hypothetical protein
MAYEMDAEGVNGVQQTTIICVNEGGGGWINPLPTPVPLPSQPINEAAVLFVTAVGEGGGDLVALQCAGNGKGAGVIGQATGAGVAGPGVGVGVAGFNIAAGDADAEPAASPQNIFEAAAEQVAGVFGQCDGGPGVKGKGGHARNPSNPKNNPVAAGTGVMGFGGLAAAASIIDGVHHRALPAGAGVVGVAGGAVIAEVIVRESIAGTGVVGIGSPAEQGFEPGRGGIFGSTPASTPGDPLVLTDNIAQIQLVPAQAPVLPRNGRAGDLYVTWIQGSIPGTPVPVSGYLAHMFLCVVPSDSASGKVAQWAPFILGAPQPGGHAPTASPTYP